MKSPNLDDGEVWANIGQEAPPYDQNELIEIYKEKLNFGLFHRLLFYLASVAMGFWFLALAIFKNNLPFWFHILALIPVWFHVCATTPRWLTLFFEDKKFRRLFYPYPISDWKWSYMLWKPTYAILKPTEEERNKYPWLPILFYSSLIFPLVSFALIFVLWKFW